MNHLLQLPFPNHTYGIDLLRCKIGDAMIQRLQFVEMF